MEVCSYKPGDFRDFLQLPEARKGLGADFPQRLQKKAALPTADCVRICFCCFNPCGGHLL